jgi:hypothetical protein
MIIIGVDFHPEFQQIASVDTETGEFQEKRLGHREEAETLYRGLAAAGQKVRVGMEASGHGRWFERLLSELQIELYPHTYQLRYDHLSRTADLWIDGQLMASGYPGHHQFQEGLGLMFGAAIYQDAVTSSMVFRTVRFEAH